MSHLLSCTEYEGSEEEESGMDWDELEEEAKQGKSHDLHLPLCLDHTPSLADKEREKHQESDEERRTQRKWRGRKPGKSEGSNKKRRR